MAHHFAGLINTVRQVRVCMPQHNRPANSAMPEPHQTDFCNANGYCMLNQMAAGASACDQPIGSVQQ